MPLNSAWSAVSRFGNSGLMLPAAAIVVGWLYIGQSHRDALRCLAWLLAATALVVAGKIAFFGWGIGIRSLNFTGVSGHAMLACALLPIMASVFLPPGRPMWHWAASSVGLLLGLAVGVSRVMVGAHSPAESAAGCLLGGLVAVAMIRGASQDGARLARGWVALPILALCLLFAYGRTWDVEYLIIQAALRVSGHAQPWSRAEWLDSGG